MSHLKVAKLFKNIKLIEPSVFLFLPPDVFYNTLFISTCRRHKVPSCPKVLPCKVMLVPTIPRYFRSWPYSTFLLHFGIHTTWCLQSHNVWLKLCKSSIKNLPYFKLWPVHSKKAFLYSLKCQTLGVPRQSRGFTHDYYLWQDRGVNRNMKLIFRPVELSPWRRLREKR